MRAPSVKSYFDDNGYELVASTPEQAAALLKSDYERYAKVVKELGLRMD
jgi:tripartite-type tricarboxylate transporter receptor subunit TctC